MDYGNERATEAAAAIGLHHGRLITASKSSYHRAYPTHLVAFNSTISDDDGHGLWWGDLDITFDEQGLIALARELSQTLHVLYEQDSRLGNEPVPFELSDERAVISPDGAVTVPTQPYRPPVKRDEEGRLVWDEATKS
jgi:hypothetical protein